MGESHSKDSVGRLRCETHEPIQVLIVDDDPIAGQALFTLLTLCPGVVVVATASDSADAIFAVAANHPDVVVTDERLPYVNGLEMARVIKSASPETRVALTTMQPMAPEELRASGEGACLLKGYTLEEMTAALRGDGDGEKVVPLPELEEGEATLP